MGYWEDLYNQVKSAAQPAAQEIGKTANLGGVYDWMKNLVTPSGASQAVQTGTQDTINAGPAALVNANPITPQINNMQNAADQIAAAPSAPATTPPAAPQTGLSLPSDQDRAALLQHLKTVPSKSAPAPTSPAEGPQRPTDQERRQMLEKNISGNKGWETAFQALGGIGDALATGINAAYRTNIPTDRLKSIIETQKTNKDEARVMLEKEIKNDPNSQTSKSAQDEFISLSKMKDPDAIAKVRQLPAQILGEKLPMVKDKIDAQLKEETLAMQKYIADKQIEAGRFDKTQGIAKESREDEQSLKALRSGIDQVDDLLKGGTSVLPTEHQASLKSALALMKGNLTTLWPKGARATVTPEDRAALLPQGNEWVTGHATAKLDQVRQRYNDAVKRHNDEYGTNLPLATSPSNAPQGGSAPKVLSFKKVE